MDLLSSYIGAEPLSEAQRYDKKEKKPIKIPCPAIVKEYNKFMGGIDLHDMLTALYKFPLKARRWYMYIFYHSIQMMVVNSWLMYRKDAKALNEKKLMKLAVFQSRLATQLQCSSTECTYRTPKTSCHFFTKNEHCFPSCSTKRVTP